MNTTKERIELTDSPMTAMIKLSEGNPGACTVLVEIFKNGKQIDPDAAFGDFAHILSLDTHGIYGSRIWMFYKDVCNQNLIHMIAILRAVQLGKMTESTMNHAIDNYGDGINPEETLKQVQETLPNFGKEVQA